MKKIGLVHIYYGDGKGKTTAAIGQIVRAVGQGFHALVFQFMKDNSSGERVLLEQLEQVMCMRGMEQVKFSFLMTEKEKEEQTVYCEKKLDEIKERAHEFDIILLDEIITAVQVGFLKEEKVVEFVKAKPTGTELILTGNIPGENLLELASYVTEMKKRKHPYDQGQASRMGIEK